jgi:hypothetical protein
MLIALLALLGVNLIVVAVLLAVVLSRTLWVRRQTGAFHGAIRVASGEIDGLPRKWRRGYGRWVRDVLVWTKSPFFFRNELVAVDGLCEPHDAQSAEVKRLGDHPVIVRVRIGNSIAEIAAREGDTELAVGPLTGAGESAALAQPAVTGGQPSRGA